MFDHFPNIGWHYLRTGQLPLMNINGQALPNITDDG